jgi:acetyl-CoA acetyltransferase
MQARRHMQEFGTTIDHFGEVAINARLNAANNPDARFRDPITMEDHHNSRMIADPIRLLAVVSSPTVAPASSSRPPNAHVT